MIASKRFSFISRRTIGPKVGNSVWSVEIVLAAPDAGLEWVISRPFFAVKIEERCHAVTTSTTLLISLSRNPEISGCTLCENV